jgi:hypothetical protein
MPTSSGRLGFRYTIFKAMARAQPTSSNLAANSVAEFDRQVEQDDKFSVANSGLKPRFVFRHRAQQVVHLGQQPERII